MIEAHQVQVGGSQFGREPVQISAEVRAEWRGTIEKKLHEYSVWKERQQRFGEDFPLNPSTCYNNGRACQFLDICNKPGSLRKNFLTANFERGIWDPTTGTVVEPEERDT